MPYYLSGLWSLLAPLSRTPPPQVWRGLGRLDLQTRRSAAVLDLLRMGEFGRMTFGPTRRMGRAATPLPAGRGTNRVVFELWPHRGARDAVCARDSVCRTVPGLFVGLYEVYCSVYVRGHLRFYGFLYAFTY